MRIRKGPKGTGEEGEGGIVFIKKGYRSTVVEAERYHCVK